MKHEHNKRVQKLKGDIAVVAVILAVAAFAALIPCFMNKNRESSQVVILINGEETDRYPLSEDKIITVSDHDGGYNLILISGGSVKVTDADCPDKLCVKQREISRSGESIICLPHKLVIMIESPEESDLDAITN